MAAIDQRDSPSLAQAPGGPPLSSVDLNLLVALDALLEEESVTRAAARLSLTQSAMSGSLARLRQLFADDLLVRRGRGMEATPFAETLAEPVHRIMAGVASVVASSRHFDPAADARTFSVLATDYSAMVLMRPVMAALGREAPRVQFELESTGILDHAGRIRRREVDLAITLAGATVHSGLPSQAVLRDRFVAVVWRHNALVGDRLSLAQFDRLPYLGFKVGGHCSDADQFMQLAGQDRRATVAVESFLLGALMLRGTDRVALLQERLALALSEMADLRVLEPPVETPPIVVTMTWNPALTDDPAHRWLRSRIVEIAHRL
ncbi:MAG: LysR substrate-binding domain-containing protein [Solirubrobacteraceae bacterium]